MSAPLIPPPQLQEVENRTGFAHLAFDKMGKGCRFYDVIVCKAGFVLEAGTLGAQVVPAPIVLSDRYWDEAAAGHSSIRAAGDVLLYKPGTDILLTGSARNHEPAASWLGGIGVVRQGQTVVQHGMRLYGPRAWQYSRWRGWQLGAPGVTEDVALRHELAYGGVQHGSDGVARAWAPNPAGQGFLDARTLDQAQAYPAPQIETPDMPLKRMNGDYPLAAPAPLARFWPQRTRFGGTYDAVWQAQFENNPVPDYPPDFDYRFFQCAHPNLVSPQHLHGDEQINLAGLLPQPGRLQLRLPGMAIHAHLFAANGRQLVREMLLDTVHIDLDARHVALTWRLTLDQQEKITHAQIGVA